MTKLCWDLWGVALIFAETVESTYLPRRARRTRNDHGIFLNAIQNAFFYFSTPFFDFTAENPNTEFFAAEKPKIAFFSLSMVKKAFFDFTTEKPKIAVFTADKPKIAFFTTDKPKIGHQKCYFWFFCSEKGFFQFVCSEKGFFWFHRGETKDSSFLPRTYLK